MTARRLLFTSLGILLALGLGIRFAEADVVTRGRLQLSTHLENTAANHTFLFVTPSGVDASTDTIVARYASGFDLTALSAPADMDIGVDNDAACDGPFTEKTVAASANTDTWGVAVSGQNLTFTAPTNAASGEITAGRCVRMRIGTNAVTGSTGTHQIVNPSSAASYEVDILGTFSDHGMFSVAIATSGTLTVSADVPNGSSSTAPTPPIVDSTAPTISNIVVLATATQATITWSTNEAASSDLVYGLTTSYGTSAPDTLFRTEHTRTIGSLTQDTTYHFRITVTDSSGNTTQSDDIAFNTLDIVPPEIQNFTIISVTQTSVTLIWDVTDTVDAWIGGATRDGMWTSTAPANTFNVTITGLTPGTDYNEVLHVMDGGELEDSVPVVFTTLADLPPLNVTNLSLTPDLDQIYLSWENPTDSDLASIMVRADTSGYPLSPSKGVEVMDSLLKDVTHLGLTSDTLYYYTVFARDVIGQYSSGATISGRTFMFVEEMPPEEKHDEITDETTPPTDTIDPLPSTPVTPTPSPSMPIDGDGVDSDVGSGEKVETPDWLPVVPEPIAVQPDTAANDYHLHSVSVEFRVANDTVLLPVSSDDNKVRVLGGKPIRLVLLPSAWTETVVSAEVFVGTESYLIQPSALFVTPDRSTSISIVIRFVDGTVRIFAYQLSVVPNGSLIRSSVEGTEEMRGVVRIFSGEQPWNALAFAQSNPLVISDGDGFGWYVPNGDYRVRAELVGGRYTEQNVQVTDAIVAPRLIFTGEKPVEENEASPTLTEETVSTISEVIADAEAVLEEIRATPVAQITATISTPAVAIATVATVSTLATSFSLLSYLRYLFSAPLLLFGRRKRSQWGVVYDSLRKVPVDLALVRLLDAKTGRVLKSQVTDKLGRYFFLVEPGTYRLAVQKAQFTFPSKLITEAQDGERVDIYHGESIEVQARGITIALNIPLDALDRRGAHEPKTIQFRRWLRSVQWGISLAGVFLALVALVLSPSTFAWSMFGLQIVVFLLFARLAKIPKPKGWGMVYDAKTKKPLARAIVRIFEPKFHKVLETQITDAKGRYAFLVGPNEYYATYQHTHYEDAELNPIDYRGKKEPGFVSESIGLKLKQS